MVHVIFRNILYFKVSGCLPPFKLQNRSYPAIVNWLFYIRSCRPYLTVSFICILKMQRAIVTNLVHT